VKCLVEPRSATLSFEEGLLVAADSLRPVRVAMEKQEATHFWRQCVRDTTGRWQGYVDIKSKLGSSYFVGCQKDVNYGNDSDVRYLAANLRVRERVYGEIQQIPEMSVGEFEEWLRSLRHDMAYKPMRDEDFPRHVPTHTPIVLGEVLLIAQLYDDPYWKREVLGPVLGDIPRHMLPRDELRNGIIEHYYPDLIHKHVYLRHIHKMLKEIIAHEVPGDETYLGKIAYFFQLLVNLHLFVNINNSVYMNIVNALLEIGGCSGIKHGILDFVALRLQTDNFSKYFISQVKG